MFSWLWISFLRQSNLPFRYRWVETILLLKGILACQPCGIRGGTFSWVEAVQGTGISELIYPYPAVIDIVLYPPLYIVIPHFWGFRKVEFSRPQEPQQVDLVVFLWWYFMDFIDVFFEFLKRLHLLLWTVALKPTYHWANTLNTPFSFTSSYPQTKTSLTESQLFLKFILDCMTFYKDDFYYFYIIYSILPFIWWVFKIIPPWLSNQPPNC